MYPTAAFNWLNLGDFCISKYGGIVAERYEIRVGGVLALHLINTCWRQRRSIPKERSVAKVTSVSYTHLDVYKRQGLHTAARTTTNINAVCWRYKSRSFRNYYNGYWKIPMCYDLVWTLRAAATTWIAKSWKLYWTGKLGNNWLWIPQLAASDELYYPCNHPTKNKSRAVCLGPLRTVVQRF